MPSDIMLTGMPLEWAMLAQLCRATYRVSGMLIPAIEPIRLRLWLIFVAYVAVVVAFVAFVAVEYRQQIVGGVHGIFIENLLHLVGPANGEQLTGLAAPVHNLTVAEVGLSQKCHVDKTHATQIKTEHKYVAGEIKRRIGLEVESSYTPHGTECQRPLYCTVHTGVYVAEGSAVVGVFKVDAPVIYRPQYAHVERCCVRNKAAVSHPCFV